VAPQVTYTSRTGWLVVSKYWLLATLRPHSTRRTSWKLVANPGWQPRFQTSFQLVANVGNLIHMSW